MATTVGGGFVYTSIVGPQGLDSVSGSGPPSPVLLPNLVAGWSLTTGPQQTLNSTGVISGGALDLTAQLTTITYDSVGAHFTLDGGSGNWSYLTAPLSALIEMGNTQSWLLAMVVGVYTPPNGLPSATAYDRNDATNALEPGLYLTPDSPNPSYTYHVRSDWQDNSFGAHTIADTNELTPGSTHSIMLAYDAVSDTISLQVDTNTPVSLSPANLASPQLNTSGIGDSAAFPGETSMETSIGRVRFWKGTNAHTIINNATWMGFIATGPTDAVLAAYTG